MIDTIYNCDCLEGLASLPDACVDCCVTSPPYWGLRDYGHDGQLGLEETPKQYVGKMVDVFREVRRVLKPEGTLWLNLGDSYNSEILSLKPKDLVGIPWRTAFALQADGWWLRQDIIWHKPNPMPESVTDRCTKAHEYIFLLSKNASYYYDNDAIKEKSSTRNMGGCVGGSKYSECEYNPQSGNEYKSHILKNKRSVWTVTTKPYKEAHFATFPEALIRPCILAGCPDGGVVLDPFMGSGTTALVALKHNRHYVGFELNPDYIELIEKRVAPWKHQSRLTGVV